MHSVDVIMLQDFTVTPGGRFRKNGKFSGEEFREEHLQPHFEGSDVCNTRRIEVNLDGVAGLPCAFLEEAFGGLARKVGYEICKRRLVIVCHDEPPILAQIDGFIECCKFPMFH